MLQPADEALLLDDGALVELKAALELGRLDGALRHCGASTLRLFAGRIARDSLITALRQEGHEFTEQRFHAWFAGLATLSDMPPRSARPPRAMCEAILSELAHSSWTALADLAPRLNAAMLAPQDLQIDGARSQAHSIIAEARDLLDAHSAWAGALPFAPLATLYEAMANNTVFAPADRRSTPVSFGARTVTIDRTPPASPRWAVEILYGEQLRQAGTLAVSLPLPNLIRLDAMTTQHPVHARSIRAQALQAAARSLLDNLGDAHAFAQRASSRPPGGRTTSRAPALFELLTGFGPLRSLQIERLLGATRLGVRSMISAWDQAGIMTRTTISGSHLYAIATRPALSPIEPGAEQDLSFSPEAIDDFEASLARLDDLLAGHSD